MGQEGRDNEQGHVGIVEVEGPGGYPKESPGGNWLFGLERESWPEAQIWETLAWSRECMNFPGNE